MFGLQLFHALGHFLDEFIMLGLVAWPLGTIRKDVMQRRPRIFPQIGI